MRLLLSIGFLVCVTALSAQDEPVATKPGPAYRIFFNFDFRRTYVNADPVRFYGFRLGAQRNSDLLSIGAYGLGDSYVQPGVELEGIGKREVRTQFSYTALTYERLFYNTKRWQIGFPMSIGLGNYVKRYVDPDGTLKPYSTNELVPIEASVHVDYNVLWWVFIGVGGGYRHVFAADPDATTTLSDWTYYVKAGLRLGEVVKRVRTSLKKHGKKGS